MKERLLLEIKSESPEFLPVRLRSLGAAILKSAKFIHIPQWNAALLRERVLNNIEVPRRSYSAFRTLTAGTLLFVFSVGVLIVAPMRVPMVQAKSTYLDSVSGEVMILRKASMIKAYSMMVLLEGDEILTNSDSGATIHFFEDSISRLGSNTDVQVNKLYFEPLNPLVTTVSMYVDSGRVWTRVVNLRDSSDFFVNTDSLRTDVKKKAAFSLESSEAKSSVAVYDNVVKVASVKEPSNLSKTVIAGYKAEITDGDVLIEKISKVSVDEEDKVWVAANLSSDEKYKADLTEDKEDAATVADAQSVPVASSIDLPDSLEADVVKQKIEDAYKVLVTSEAQLVRGARQEGIKGLADFRNRVAVIIGTSLPNLEENDPLYAGILRDLLIEKINIQLKDFASFRPGDRLYRAKEALQEVEVTLASTEVQKVEVQMAQAEDALLEMQELLVNGQFNLAQTLLKRYENKANKFLLTLTADNEVELSDRFAALIQRQVDNIKILTSIEQSIVYREQFVLRHNVGEVRSDTLRKVIIALEQNPNKVSDEALLQLKDLYDSYVDKESGESDLIEPAVSKLLNDDYQVQFISPDAEGAQIESGVIMLTPQEATADVSEGSLGLKSGTRE